MTDRVAVIGAGQMGNGIAHVFAQSGIPVTMIDVSDDALRRGRETIKKNMDRQVKKNAMSPDDRQAALGRIGTSTDLGAVGNATVVVEAATENTDLKFRLFADLDRIAPAGAILASNTSSIPIMKLGMATARPEQVIGIHFFNPVPVLRLVELVTSLLTSPATVEVAERFASEELGKKVIRSQDRAGFVVNALLIPYILSAIRMMESGFATADDIDTGMVEGCNHPMGPLHLADLIGLDTTLAVAESLYEEFKEPLYAPPPMLSRMVEAGLLGRKSGRGFYEYAKR